MYAEVLTTKQLVIIQDYNFACGSVWVQNLVLDIKGGT
jgi:hypothetical protein